MEAWSPVWLVLDGGGEPSRGAHTQFVAEILSSYKEKGNSEFCWKRGETEKYYIKRVGPRLIKTNPTGYLLYVNPSFYVLYMCVFVGGQETRKGPTRGK